MLKRIPGKVAFAEPPGQYVDFFVQHERHFRADEIGGAGAGAPGQQSPVVAVAAVLGGGGVLLRRHGSHAVNGAGLVNVESLRGAAHVAPTEVLLLPLVPDLVVVKDVTGILTGTRRQSDEGSCDETARDDALRSLKTRKKTNDLATRSRKAYSESFENKNYIPEINFNTHKRRANIAEKHQEALS